MTPRDEEIGSQIMVGFGLLFCLVCLAVSSTGCTDLNRTALDQQLVETQAEIARIKLAATTQPSAPGEAKRIEDLERAIVLLRAAIASQPTTEGIGAVLRAIPGVGPYADLIGLLVGGALGFLAKRKQSNEQLSSVLTQWHNEDKPGTTPALENVIAMTGVQPKV